LTTNVGRNVEVAEWQYRHCYNFVFLVIYMNIFSKKES